MRDDNSLMSEIEHAFAWREIPESSVTAATSSWSSDHDEAAAFQGIDWREISSQFLRDHSVAFSFFTGEAFRYYLPSVLAATIRDDCRGLLAADTLLLALDRSNTPSSWDDLFIQHWVGLTPKECEVVGRWLLWLLENRSDEYDQLTLGRALDTIVLLRDQAVASPIALK